MCPDHQIISLYHDGELPSPWKEKMEAHLEICPECKSALASYSKLGKQLDDLDEENILAARERVWKKLTAPALVVPRETGEKGPVVVTGSGQWHSRQRIWNRSIPLPAAAAAAVLIIVTMFAIFTFRDSGRSRSQDLMASIPEYLPVVGNDQGMVPISDMSTVLQYLSSMDNGDFMVIRLPESRNFIRPGEPALINAADYSRRQMSR